MFKTVIGALLVCSIVGCATVKADEAKVKTEAAQVETAFATCAAADGSAALKAAGGWTGVAVEVIGVALAGPLGYEAALDGIGAQIGEDAYDCLLDGVEAVLTGAGTQTALARVQAYKAARLIKRAVHAGSGSGSASK